MANIKGGRFVESLSYPIRNPRTGEDHYPSSEGNWRFNRERIAELMANDELYFGEDGKGRPKLKRFLCDVKEGMTYPTIWDFVPLNTQGSSEMESILGSMTVFENPKPVGLIRELLNLGSGNDSIILDFFSGSGTTAQAVMELNKADGGNRKFILVQLPELTDASSPAHKAGFKKISDITIERAKRVVQKLKTEAEDFLPNDPQRQFADTLGFKVFTLAKSAFPRVEFAPDPAKTEAENIELLKQYIRDKEATFHLQFEKDKVLDEVLLKNGFMLDYTLTPQPDIKKNEVVLAKDAHKESLVCLDAKLEPETVDYFKKHKGQFFICLELALDTTKKWNLKHNLGEKLKAI